MSRLREAMDAMYRRDPDPWRFRTSAYEAGKYDATLAALGPGGLGAVLEVGCSIGVLSARLAARADALLGIDVSPLAVEAARAQAPPRACFRVMEAPDAWPAGRFDLVVLSEVLYFLAPGAVDRLAARVAGSLSARGRVLLVNWLGPTEQALSGAQARDRFLAAWPGTPPQARRERHDGFEIVVLEGVVEPRGIEPLTSSLRTTRSPS